jgi:peptidoglycan/LPS O-acetylase OafA/YrhL
MEQKNKRRTDIIILRTLSMMMIVLCHIIHYYTFIPGSQILGQVFNVGVQIFLLISGYLYGMKSTWAFSRWIVQRVRRICIPVFLVAVADILVLSVFFAWAKRISIISSQTFFSLRLSISERF